MLSQTTLNILKMLIGHFLTDDCTLILVMPDNETGIFDFDTIFPEAQKYFYSTSDLGSESGIVLLRTILRDRMKSRSAYYGQFTDVPIVEDRVWGKTFKKT